MTDPTDRRDSGFDGALERRLGIRGALLEMWAPGGRSVALVLDDSGILMAGARTRDRLVRVHAVFHALLRGEPAGAVLRLQQMSGQMRVFTALRGLSLSADMLEGGAATFWPEVLEDACVAVAAALPVTGTEMREGATTLHAAVDQNVKGRAHQRILDCLAEATDDLSPARRVGAGLFGAATFVAGLRKTAGISPEALVEEHAALVVALAGSRTVTLRDGRLVVDDG